MLINCKPGCVGKKITTTASLDVETNAVICDLCGESIEASSFTKNSMKQRGDIVRKDERKPFQFDCQTCGKLVETEISIVGASAKLIGKNCNKGCKFNVSKFTINAMKNLKSGPKLGDRDEDNNGFYEGEDESDE